MAYSFLQDRESDADWEPEALELPLWDPRPRYSPTTIEIDAPESEHRPRVIVIELT